MKNLVDTARASANRGQDQIEDTVRALTEPEEFYTPPMSVAVARPEHRPDWARNLRSETWLVRPPSAFPGMAQDAVRLNNAEQGLDFPINFILVDNVTAGWLFWHEMGVWVPPFTIGRGFRFDGSHKAYARFETPGGLTAVPVATQTQRARIVFHNEVLPETVGFQLPAGDR